MMSIAARRELLEAVAPRYVRASRPEKERILDEFVQTTGYARKYAIHLLHHVPRERRPFRRRRARKYPPAARAALVTLWRAANGICSKRLVPFLPELIAVLERCGELQLDADTKALVLQMSPATVDRLLRRERQGLRRRGLGTTKPGTLRNALHFASSAKSPSAPSRTGMRPAPASWRWTWWPTAARPPRENTSIHSYSPISIPPGRSAWPCPTARRRR